MTEFVGTPRQCTMWLMERDPDAKFVVKEWRDRRSKTANGYYWALVTKLSSALGISKDETHDNLLKQYAECEVVTVLSKVPLESYFDHYEVFAQGYLNGREYNHVRVYKGSSEMDSAEFSRLLKGCIYECEQQGIETLTPREIEMLPWVDERRGS